MTARCSSNAILAESRINIDALLDTLRSLEIEMHQPHVRATRSKLAQLLHPSFFEVARSGVVYSRERGLAEFRAVELSATSSHGGP
jgi:hypothetical protein